MQLKINIALCVFIIAAISISLMNYFNQSKTAFVNNIELYNGFIFKNELEKKMMATQKAREQILDSLLLNLNVLSKQIDPKDAEDNEKMNQFQGLRQQYGYKKQQFEEDNTALGQEYTDQIWKQLNQYVKDYGKENNYTYVFGTEGRGNLMYATELEDITEELLEYVNAKYEGIEN